MKRISLQDSDYKCLPLSPIVDRPMNKPPILPDEKIDILEYSDSWGTLWNIAFSLCLIKNFQDDQDIQIQIRRLLDDDSMPTALFTILSHPYINRPFDIIHDCLASRQLEKRRTIMQVNTKLSFRISVPLEENCVMDEKI